MKFEIDDALIAQLIEALKDQTFGTVITTLATIGAAAWVITIFIKAGAALTNRTPIKDR